MKNRGFTLVELVLVIALLVISAGVSTDIIISLTRSYNKTQITNEIEQNANFVLLKLERELRNARGVNVSADTLVLDTGTPNDITYCIAQTGPSCNPAGNIIARKVAGVTSLLPLTDNVAGVEVVCSGSSGRCFEEVNSDPQVIRVTMRFKQVGSPSVSFTGDVEVDTTIVIRGTY